MNYLQNTVAFIWMLLFTITSCEISENATMKAVLLQTFGKPEVLKVQDVPIPALKKKQVLVRVKAAGISPVDAYIRAGTCQVLPKLPTILGKEIAGIIEQADPSVNEFKVGDRVFCGVDQGGYAEYAVANVTECFPLTERSSFAEGSAIYSTYFTVFRGIVIKGQLSRGKLLLVHGAVGFLGAAAVQIAKELGARVVASVRSEPAADLMKECKADYIAYHTDDNYLDQALTHMRKTRFDVILELVPGFDLYFDRKYLHYDGRIIVLGSRLPDKRNSRATYVVSYFKYALEDQKEAADFMVDAMEVGAVKPIIDKEFQMNEAPQAHYHLAYENAEKGKIVFIME